MNEQPNRPLVFSAHTRAENVHELGRLPLDILVVGGGITGAGIARDAALRGYRTGLIEKDDFASGTSSKSSKLIHGGLRYLKNLEFGLVHEALSERKTLMRIAPHLVHPLECLLPIYESNVDPSWMIHLGLLMYDALSLSKSIGRHRMIAGSAADSVAPRLRKEGLKQIAQYYDCGADDFRLVMANIQSAAQVGGVMANYVRAEALWWEDGVVVGLVAKDTLTGTLLNIRSHTVVNAAGPWSDQLRCSWLEGASPRIRTTKGVHLILNRDRLAVNHPIAVPAVADGRPVFAIPWRRFVVLGTTDTEYSGDPDRVCTEREDVDYLLTTFNYYFPEAHLTMEDVVSTFAGLRPLVDEGEKSESQVTREYEIFEGPGAVFSIVGGKLTTYRTMALEMVNRLMRKLQKSFHQDALEPRCRTHERALYGGEIEDFAEFRKQWLERLRDNRGLDDEVAEHLVETYGSALEDVETFLDLRSDGNERILPRLPFLWGELDYALAREMCVGLDDFAIRRTHLFSLDHDQGQAVLEEMAGRMADVLGWKEAEIEQQKKRYLGKIGVIQGFRGRIETP